MTMTTILKAGNRQHLFPVRNTQLYNCRLPVQAIIPVCLIKPPGCLQSAHACTHENVLGAPGLFERLTDFATHNDIFCKYGAENSKVAMFAQHNRLSSVLVTNVVAMGYHYFKPWELVDCIVALVSRCHTQDGINAWHRVTLQAMNTIDQSERGNHMTMATVMTREGRHIFTRLSPNIQNVFSKSQHTAWLVAVFVINFSAHITCLWLRFKE